MNEWLNSFIWAEPLWAILILLIPPFDLGEKKSCKSQDILLFPTLTLIFSSHEQRSKRWIWLPSLLRLFSLLLIITALCRPQLDRSTKTILSSGVDIVFAVDLSASMLALDMSESESNPVTRLDVVKMSSKVHQAKKT